MADQPRHADLYERVRAEVIEGVYARNERIDLQRLADVLRVSTTPLREVLYQLSGEGLIESHPSGGFQARVPDARSLQDLYSWNGHHLLAAVHLLPDPVIRRAIEPTATIIATLPRTDPTMLTERLATALGEATGNPEFSRHIETANARLHRARMAEQLLFPDRLKELASIVKTDGFDARTNVRRRMTAYHRRRVEQAPQIAALIR